MNVLIIDKTGLDDKKGGMARAISTLIQSLFDQKIGVVRLIPGPWYQHTILKKKRRGRVTYSMDFPLPLGSGSILKRILVWMIRFPKALFQIKKILRDEAIDIVHTTYHSTNILIWLCNRLWGVKYVVTLHGSDAFLFDRIPVLHGWLAKIVVRGANAVIPVSDGVEQAAQKNFGRDLPFARIYNGVKTDGIVQLAGSRFPAIDLPLKYIVAVGNFVPVKGYDVLLLAWRKVLKSFPDVSLVMVGDGPERGRYEKLCSEWGIENRVYLPGWLSYPETLHVLGGAVIHIMSSRSEGLPYVLLEAGALKVATIATLVGGIPEVLSQDKFGVLVPPDDFNSLARALYLCLGDVTLRNKIANGLHHRVNQNFSSEHMGMQHCQLYKRVIKKVD